MLACSPRKISLLRAAADRGPAGSLDRLIAACKLSALEGDTTAARAHLAKAAELLSPDDHDRVAANGVIAAAIITGQMDVADSLLRTLISPTREIHVAVDDALAREAPTVRWSLSDDGISSFWMNPYLFRTDNTDLFVDRWLHTLPLILRYLESERREPGTLELCLGDHGAGPGLAYCDYRLSIFLIPDPVFIQSQGYAALRANFAARRVAWRDRRPVALWRGGSSGRPTSRETGWRSLPRVRLCEIGRAHPELIDAGITQITQMPDPEGERELASSGLMAPRLSATQFDRFKYQIDIDGNANSWSGLFQKLLSGGVVLKVSSPEGFRQWYYDRLQPWVNFVPVAADMADLVEKVEWLQTHDREARAIARRGRRLALSLGYQTELSRAVPTIAAAFRYLSGGPELNLRFGAKEEGSGWLIAPWARAEKDAVWALGNEARFALPRPAAIGDFSLYLEVSPCIEPPHPPPLMAVVINGEIVTRVVVGGRLTVRCNLPARLLGNAERLIVTLLLPNASPRASVANPLDDRMVSIKLHGVILRRGATPQTAVTVQPAAPTRASSEDPALAPAAAGTTRQVSVMHALHRTDIWRGYVPSGPRQDAIQGWNGVYPPFKRFLEQAPNKIFVDVGVWKGQSTLFVAELMRQSAIDGCVIAVDTFLGSVEHWAGARELFGRRWGRPDLYETFLDNVYYRNFMDLVVPLPQTSMAAAAILRQRKIKVGIVHIDAAHEYEDVLRDAEVYWSLIEPGGFLIGDDYHESWPGVVSAAHDFVRRVGGELAIVMPKWIVRKPL